MSNQLEDIQVAGSDTRPPMLDRTDFESWQQQIRLYCKGKDHGEYILQSIDEGPFKMGKYRDEIASGPDGSYLGPERDRSGFMESLGGGGTVSHSLWTHIISISRIS
ncbi:hypothetical protein Tco_0025740 [Tanacetum coccineum]